MVKCSNEISALLTTGAALTIIQTDLGSLTKKKNLIVGALAPTFSISHMYAGALPYLGVFVYTLFRSTLTVQLFTAV